MQDEKNVYNRACLFDQLDTSNSASNDPIWLIYAETSIGQSFTSSSVSGYQTYARLNYYREDLEIINKQLDGERGIYAANLIISMPRSGTSVAFFNQFCAKNVLNKMHIIELVEIGGSTSSAAVSVRQKITYKTCKVESYKNFMDHVELSINYLSRADKYSQYENGAKSGNVVSSFA